MSTIAAPAVTITLTRDEARNLHATLAKAQNAYDADADMHRRLTTHHAEANARAWSAECARLAAVIEPATRGRSVVTR